MPRKINGEQKLIPQNEFSRVRMLTMNVMNRNPKRIKISVVFDRGAGVETFQLELEQNMILRGPCSFLGHSVGSHPWTRNFH